MKKERIGLFITGIALIAISSFFVGCTTKASGRYYGVTVAPKENVLHYVSGSEPESLDPGIPTGQPEARVLMALYDGLVEYDPKTMESIPGIAKTWEISPDGTEYLFHLRPNATFSNGKPITARDFAYTFRRNLDPALAAKNAYLSYYLKYAEAYNSGKVFVKKPDGTFLHKADLSTDTSANAGETTSKEDDEFGGATEFHKFLNEPERYVLPGSDEERQKLFAKDAKLKAAVVGAEYIPVKATDLGVEAVDDLTFRIKLIQPAPFFIGLLGHQFFRVIDQVTVEKYGADWTKPENIVTSGPFMLKEHHPYDRVIVVKNPNYWDADMVRLDRIEFYPLDEATTMMNLYQAGDVDAMYNHTVPAAWNEVVSQYKDEFMNAPEVAIEYYTVNVKQKPMDNVKLRRALALSIDRKALAKFRKTVTPLVDFTPEGIFPKYEQARKKVYTEELAKQGSSLEEWKAREFDPVKARSILKELGYTVNENNGRYSVPDFPVDKVEVLYNTAESNKAVAEFLQAQWKQNLGITLSLNNMEWKTFLNVRKELDYHGLARAGWVGDYMDPFTFLNLFYSENNDSSTGWSDPKFDKLLDAANKEQDEMKRFEILARAELMVMQQQPVIPLVTQATNWIKKPYVKGMYPNPGTLHPWKFVYIEHDESKWDHDVENIMQTVDPWVQSQIDRLSADQNALKAAAESKTAAAGN